MDKLTFEEWKKSDISEDIRYGISYMHSGINPSMKAIKKAYEGAYQAYQNELMRDSGITKEFKSIEDFNVTWNNL